MSEFYFPLSDKVRLSVFIGTYTAIEHRPTEFKLQFRHPDDSNGNECWKDNFPGGGDVKMHIILIGEEERAAFLNAITRLPKIMLLE